MKRFVAIYFCVVLMACHQNANNEKTLPPVNENDTSLNKEVLIDLTHVKKGWSMEKVIKKIGEPQQKQNLGKSTDENGKETELENWFYNNGTQQITFINGEVSGVSFDVAAADDKVNATIDSALKSQGNHGVIIQPGH